MFSEPAPIQDLLMARFSSCVLGQNAITIIVSFHSWSHWGVHDLSHHWSGWCLTGVSTLDLTFSPSNWLEFYGGGYSAITPILCSSSNFYPSTLTFIDVAWIRYLSDDCPLVIFISVICSAFISWHSTEERAFLLCMYVCMYVRQQKPMNSCFIQCIVIHS